jgi:DNA polymerase III subunit epsilon
VVPLRTCTFRIRRAQDHPACVRKDLGSCGAPCDGTQDEAAYATVVAAAEAALEDPELLLGPLRQRMAALAAEGRFERAGELRSRLHGAARALAGARRRDRLAGCVRLVVCRPTPEGLEVAVIRRGRLAATGRLDPTSAAATSAGGGPDAGALALAERLDPGTDPAPPGREDAEEVGLVATWLDRPDVRALAVDGEFSSTTRGGAALAAALVEGRRVARQVRRDRQQLAGRKVRRRDGTG